LIPLLLLIPVIVSGLYLFGEMTSGALTGSHLVILATWFLAAIYLQFLGGSTGLWVAGLVAQVFLAIYLRLRATLAQ